MLKIYTSPETVACLYQPNGKLPASSTLMNGYCWLSIGWAAVIAILCNNQPLATNNQANFYEVQVCQQEWKLIQTQYMYDNSSMLTWCPLFHAQAVTYSVAILLAFPSACRQKALCHVTFATIYWNCTTISYLICCMTIIW